MQMIQSNFLKLIIEDENLQNKFAKKANETYSEIFSKESQKL